MKNKFIIFLLQIFLILLVCVSASFFVSVSVYNKYWKKTLQSFGLSQNTQNIDFINDNTQDKKSAIQKDFLADSLNNQVWILAKSRNSKSANILDKVYFNDNFIAYATVVTSDGWLISNNPIKDTSSLVIINNKNEIIPVEKILKDQFLGLSYIKINKTGLEPIAISDSSDLFVGENVYGISPNIYNYQNEASYNSIKNLHSRLINQKSDLIHKSSDIAIYGLLVNNFSDNMPVVNQESQLIGFSANLQGKTYLLPGIYVRSSMKAFFDNNNSIVYPTLNISYIDLSEVVLDSNLPKVGALVYDASKNPQLKKDDVIVSVNDERISELKTLNTILLDYKVGSEVSLTILRGSKEQKINTKLTSIK